ncbi:hypothetical protein HH212_14060 [Massilia forsythiae]|uniref:Fido domain-containing protein n=1 Tax=Massilia forsythiae TaxID=2728020 RepID=A0A7Z2ZUG3_9BURK|nr:Fic family protein [Massilia forsythiae]QJE01017.1 hypothetical protein HH212_14060 [Massilia forsythiae]
MDRPTTARLHQPLRWAALPPATRERLARLEIALMRCLPLPDTGYDALRQFAFAPTPAIAVRPAIRAAVLARGEQTHAMTSERAVVARFAAMAGEFAEGFAGVSLYALARRVRSALFGSQETLRRVDLTITFLPWLRLAPPAPADPLHRRLDAMASGHPVLDALNAYLVLLTAHPFTDGNGRTARIVFNLVLRRHYPDAHYLPLTELCRPGAGDVEELLARANIGGDYLPVLDYLAELLCAYCAFRLRGASDPVFSDPLAEIASLLDSRPIGAEPGRRFDLNKIAPFPVSMRELLALPDHGVRHTADSGFVRSIADFAHALSAFGSVQFALTTLDSLCARHPERSITFFVQAHRKEDLLLRFRELRRMAEPIHNVELAVSTGDPALDAKLLINLSGFYTEHRAERDALLILNDFPIHI